MQHLFFTIKTSLPKQNKNQGFSYISFPLDYEALRAVYILYSALSHGQEADIICFKLSMDLDLQERKFLLSEGYGETSSVPEFRTAKCRPF